MKVLLVLLWASCVCAGSQETGEWEQWMDAGRANLTRLDFAGAAASFQRAANLAGSLPPEGGELVLVLNGLATAHKQMGRLAEASREYRRAIDLSEHTRLRGTLTYSYLLASLATVEIERRSFGQAKQMLAEAIEIDERAGSPDSVQLAIARQLMAKVLVHDGNYEAADKLLSQAVQVFRSNPDTPPDLLPFALDNVGNLRRLQGRPEDALAAFQQEFEAFASAFGSDHPVIILALNNLGVQFFALGRNAEARTSFERAVTLLDRNEKTDPATKGHILANYAGLLRQSGDSRGARAIERRASAIQGSLTVDVTMLGPTSFRKE